MICRSILFAMAALTVPALAQTPLESVSLANVIALAGEASPRLTLERQSIAVAEAERRSADAYPNPTLSYGRQRQGNNRTQFDGKWAQAASVEFPLLVAGQHGARVAAAERGIDAARARVAATVNDLAADAGAAVVGLLSAQEKRKVLAAALDELERLRAVVAGRQSSGMASRYDLLRMDVEVDAWRARFAEAEADLADKQGQLAALLGFSGWRPTGLGELHPLPIRADSDLDAESPAVAAARLDAIAAAAGVEVAKRERFPGFSLNAGRAWTSDPAGSVASLGLSVEIPIFDSRGGALDRAQAEAQSARLRLQLADAEVHAAIQRYSALVVHRGSALEQFRAKLSSSLPALGQMAEDAYRLGKSSIAELLDATRTRYESELGQLELIAGLMEAQLRLQAARGELLAQYGAAGR